MKIVIENTPFPYDLGCRLLKLKHENSPFEQLNDIWDDIKPLTFREIAQMENLEHRRVGVVCLGLERLVKEVKPKLVSSQTIEKETSFIDRDGKYVKQKFDDTYELYEVDGKVFGQGRWGQNMDNTYFVKFKDTSTDREYMIWIDPRSVLQANSPDKYVYFNGDASLISPIQCIAWTIQTTVQRDNIKEIIRQGDCVLVKPKNPSLPLLDAPRHLTENEYRKFLVAES